MRSLLISVFVCVLVISSVHAQQFSENKTEFREQAIAKLKSIGKESTNKIAFDFQNAWDSKFTNAQQDKAHRIALTMQKKGYKFYPYFYHFFTYLAYSVAQENLQRDQLDKVLEINEQVVQTLSKSEYKDFLFGLNIYFARRYLSLDKNLAVQVVEGSYQFKLLDEYIDLKPGEEVIEENTAALIVEEEVSEIPDNSSSDSWGNSDDPWEDSNDSWGNSWDNEPEPVAEEPKAVRPSYIPIVRDYLTQKQYQYVHPELEGPVIEITNARTILSTPYDSLKIKSVNGTFLLKNRTLAGKQGFIEWPGQNSKFKRAVIQLKEFHLKKGRSDFWTPNATLQFDKLTGAGQVEGVFEFRSVSRPPQTLNGFPVFTSNNANVSVKLNDDKLSYVGGIQLKGNKLYGKAISRKPGTLKILDRRGNTVVLKSIEFFLGDSLVSMNSGSISILHGSDSIFHNPSGAKFDINTQKLLVLRNNTLTPYKSSYFDVSMNVDLMTWNMGVDSITMEIMNGKDLLPATFESEDFFNLIRYKKLGRFLDFHPLNASVFYSRKYGLDEFYVGEMAVEFGIDERFAKGVGKVLSQYGFADYNATTGLLKLYPKAFLYYDALLKRSILITS